MPVTRIHVDSRAGTSHENTNPWDYEVPLPTALRSLTKVKLIQAYIPNSGLFTVTRSTTSYTAVTTHDTIHLVARALEQATHKGTHNALIITNDSGTANLQVHKIVTQESTLVDGARFRSYATFLCTGTMSNSDRDTWRLIDPSDTDGVEDQVLWNPHSNGDMDGVYTGVVAGETSGLAVFSTPQHLYMSIKLNGSSVPLVQSPLTRAKFERWRSYKLYEEGDVVYETGKTLVPGGDGVRAICLKSHLSLNWELDIENGFWNGDLLETRADEDGRNFSVQVSAGANTTSKHGADGAFHVFFPPQLSEGVVIESRPTAEAEVRFGSVDKMRITFENAEGRPYRFPYEGAFAVTDAYAGSDAMTVRRSFKHHALTFEIEHA